MDRTLLVLASSLLRRAHEAVSAGRRDGEGRPTHALFFSLLAVRTGLSFKEPARAAAVVDEEPEENDPAWPEALRDQHARLPSLFEAHGIPVVKASPARHQVAALVRAALEAGDDVVVVGTDKRLAQLVGPRVWWYDGYKDVRYTPEVVKKRFGVEPARCAEWLALVGDDEDLPGIAGIGAKGATALLEEHGSVGAALEHLDAIKGRTGNALRAAGTAQVREELERARLDDEVPLLRPLADLAYRAPDEDALQSLYAELGFVELLKARADAGVGSLHICTTPEEVREAIPSLRPGPIAVDVVTEEPSAMRGDLVGVACVGPDDAAIYLPLRSPDGERPELLGELASVLADPAIPKQGHDLTRVAVALARRGFAFEGQAGDSEHASHLTEPSGFAPHDLPLIARRVLHAAPPDEDELLGVGKRRRAYAAVSTREVAGLAVARARAARAIFEKLAPTIVPRLLEEYAALADTLVRMELRGIACDAADLERTGSDFAVIREGLEREIFELAGRSFNLGSTKQLGEVLFEELRLPAALRTKTGFSTSNEALERIEHAHPIVALVMRWRLLRRLTDTWVTALIAAIDDDGRVRSTFHLARSFSGRLVNSQPDLGRVPGRTPEMKRIRRAFVAPPGTVLMSVDYQQLGLYVLAHLSKDPALIGPLRDGGDLHVQTASAVLGLAVDDVGERERQMGKVVNFASFASQGSSALGQQLGVEPPEARAILERFHEKYAAVRAFHDEQLRLAKERGYVETLAGRRWPIHDLEAPDTTMRSYAERLARRATHEGSVADIGRRGLLLVDQRLRAAGLRAAPVLQILDEVLLEVPEHEVAEAAAIAADAMRHAYELEVPLRVGVEVGPNWADLAPLGAKP